MSGKNRFLVAETQPCHNMANFGPLMAEIGLGVWGTPANFNWFHVLPFTAATSVTRGQPNCTILDRLLCWYTIYTFLGALAPWRNFAHCRSHFTSKLAFSYIDSVTAHTPAACVSQTLQRGTRNGITELLQRLPPIFGWAAITFGIGPRSSCSYFAVFNDDGYTASQKNTDRHITVQTKSIEPTSWSWITSAISSVNCL